MKMLDEHGISAELRSIIENTHDLVFVKNRDFVYIASSKSFALDCVKCNGVEDVIGKTDFELFEDQALAARYRADDEALFASGKPMIEFQERYPGENGKNLLCLTTKYLLRDPDGTPMAILGQYHNTSEQVEAEIHRHRDLNRNVANALGKSFFAANYADLQAHRYITIQSAPYVKKMLNGCETIEQAFDSFIRTLVKPEFHETMREFCDSATLAQRLRGKRQIDCVYLSNVASGWCKASFYPCEWDETGQVTHTLFAVSSVAEEIALEIEDTLASKRDLSTIFEVAPVGIAVYKWDQKKLTFLNANPCFLDFLGYDRLDAGSEPAYSSLHRDDLPGFKDAIAKALSTTQHLEYVFRAWKKDKLRFGWLRCNAVAKPQADGTSLVYAVFTDVTEQKLAKLRLDKSQASIMSALGAAEQYSYEYDPVKHTSTSFSKEATGYHLDTVIKNYPECFRDSDFMHPDDVERFIDTVHQIDDGAESAHCVIRANKNGIYHWHSCTFDAFFDWEKEYRIALLTVVDITPQIVAKQEYETRIRSLLTVQKDILTMCTINVSKDTFEMVRTEEIMQPFATHSPSFEATMMSVLPDIADEESKKAYRQTFSRQNLLKQALFGHTRFQQEYLLKMSSDHYEWVTAVVELVRNPMTDEITGVAYSKSTQRSHMEHDLLASALKLDYLFSAIVFKATDEFYIYSAETDSFSERQLNFWDVAFSKRSTKCSQETLAYMKDFYNKEKMFRYLDNHAEFSYAFDSGYLGEPRRLETKFRYLDKSHNTILVTLRDITDQNLLEQWHYDSEHDDLTGLLNRKTVFKETRRLLTEHPDTQFVMVHSDVRHFHLYNTFFGEETGDALLCRIANVLQNRKDDYDYFTCGRIESDVFCVCFSAQMDVFENHMRACLQELKTLSPDFPLRLAIGAYWITDPSMSIEAMFSRATVAAKSHQKNLFGLVSRYDSAMDKSLLETQQITSEMAAAIEQKQFQVYLQPKFSLRSGKPVGAEALVRWLHPQRGMISPGKFIPVFEQNGFIANLDRYMWEQVCQVLRRWKDEVRPLYPVSVNISRVSMYSHATVPFLKSLIEKYGLDAKYLELELTETAYIDDPKDLKRMLKELQAFGFKILMDDFGSGYSSLNTLRELPVDVLKLDMRFLSDTKDDPRANAVLSSVVRMSKLLKLPIVAEGIETKEQADYLRSIGCEYVQGFLFAKPMPVGEYEKLLEKELFTQPQEGTACESEPGLPEAAPTMNALASLGVLEYANGKFAYLHANKRFLREFDLIENLKPASAVFREHLDDKNYEILLKAFAHCSETKAETMFYILWVGDDGNSRNYQGHVSYNGNIGTYADLSVVFVNITNMQVFGQSPRLARTQRKLSFMEAAIDYMPNPVFIKGDNARFVFFNQQYAQRFNMAKEDYIGGTVLDLKYLPEEDRRKYQAEDLNLIETGEISSYDKNFIFDDGKIHPTLYWSRGFVCPDTGEHGLVGEIVDISGERNLSDNLSEIVRGTAFLFERFYVVDLENGVYSTIDKNEANQKKVTLSTPSAQFFQKALGRFYNPLNKLPVDYCFTQEGLAEMLKDRDDYYLECKDKLHSDPVFGVTIYCIERRNKIPVKVIFAIRDITDTKATEYSYHSQLKKANRKLKDLANRDALTNLLNRRGLMEFVNTQLTEQSRVGMLLMDIDRFKSVNDIHGHIAGDKLLRRVAALLKESFRSKDVIVRLGGDEFMVLLLDCGFEKSDFIAKKIQRLNEALKAPTDDTPAGSLSVGAAFSRPGESQELYDRADAALYKVKERGRCGLCIYEEEFETI